MNSTIRTMLSDDWSEVLNIYQSGINSGISTFETSPPIWDNWDRAHLKECRLVIAENDQILGWAALSPVSGRCVYGGVAEVSIYVDSSVHGRGYGTLLLKTLIEESEHHGIWTLQATIFRSNRRSIILHEKAGFRYVGYREKIGQLKGEWLDTLLFEKRSSLF